MSIHVCKCIHSGREEYHLRYPGMTEAAAQELADEINGGALSYAKRYKEEQARRRAEVGAGEAEHDWKCVSPGEYDTLYECAKCGARHMEQADRLGSEKPKFGCTHNVK